MTDLAEHVELLWLFGTGVVVDVLELYCHPTGQTLLMNISCVARTSAGSHVSVPVEVVGDVTETAGDLEELAVVIEVVLMNEPSVSH